MPASTADAVMPRVEQRERTCDSAEGDGGFWDMVYYFLQFLRFSGVDLRYTVRSEPRCFLRLLKSPAAVPIP